MYFDNIMSLSQSLIPPKRFDRFVQHEFPSQSLTGFSAIENNFSMLSLTLSFIAEPTDLSRTAVRDTVQVQITSTAVVVFFSHGF